MPPSRKNSTGRQFFQKKPSVRACVIGIVAPIPNQKAINVPAKNTNDASGRLNGFWNLFTFSIKGTVIKPRGTAAIEPTPNNLLGITRSKLNVGKK